MTRKLGMEFVYNLANNRGGKCLSDEYKDIYHIMKWKCINNHIWQASYSSAKRSWCTICKLHSKEKLCKLIFETLFDKTFIKVRLPNRCELDGYNKELKLAFEYNGVQHYTTAGKYNSLDNLKRNKLNMLRKMYYCKKNNITLIIIPYNIKEIKEYIINKCKQKNISIPFINKEIDYNLMFQNKDILAKYNEFAESMGGKLLSTSYINAVSKLKWQCSKGHIWEATLNGKIKNSKKIHWCPFCSGNNRKTINDMNMIASNNNIKFISNKYLGIHIKHKWQCNKGHIWMTTPGRILLGYRCPACYGGVSKKRIEGIKNGSCF